MSKTFKLSKVERLPGSEILVEGSVSEDAVLKHRSSVIAKLQKTVEIPGFRKGHVPDQMLIERVGEMAILSEAAEEALNEAYPSILESEKIFMIGTPAVSITKLAPGNPIEFTIRGAILPEFKIADYKKIAKKEMTEENTIEVTEKDIEGVINEIRGHFAHMELHKKGVAHDHAHPEIKEEDMPVFDDAFVKSIGEFKDVEDFKVKAKENITKEKEKNAREKKRAAILEEILKETEITVPKILIENELDKMLAQFKDEISRAGTTYDTYLKQVGKTEQTIKDEWKETAEKKARVQLIINKISEEEKIIPDADKVRADTEKILVMYPDADPVRARLYVAQMMLNEDVMKFLENQK